MESPQRAVTRPERRPGTRARRLRRARAEAFLRFGDGPSLTHLAGLDGLRGIAVAAVVCFHGGFGWMRGGYLGVSLFFTLSGFLITSLLLNESTSTGRVGLRSFWGRRFRRLLPAAWLTLVGVGIAAVALDDVGPGLRGDLWAAAANVANWRFLATGSSYADLFTSRSPVLHFWSLAIEEQFYLLYPLVFVALWTVCRGRRRWVGAVLGVLAVGSFALPILAPLGVDRIYYGTDARAGELLVGAVVAVLLSAPALRRRLVRNWWWRSAVSLGGLASLGGAVALWVTATEGDSRLRAGLLPVVAASSIGLVVSAAVPAGLVRRIADLPPLRWLGRVSYGVYLFHWPVLVWSGATRTGPQHAERFLVGMAAVLLAAGLSQRFVELPIRRLRWQPAVLRPLAALAAVALAIGPAVVGARVDAAQDVFAGLDRAAADFSAAPVDTAPSTDVAVSVQGTVVERPPETVATTVPALADPPVISFFGDSISLSLAMTMGYWNQGGAHFVDGKGVALLGCGVIPGGTMRYDRVRSMPRECDGWSESWPAMVRAVHADVAVVQSCQWETIERRYPGMAGFVAPGDPAADDAIRRGYLAAVDLLTGAGADLVVWVRCPHFSRVNGVRHLEPGLLASREPARIDRLNQLIEEVAAARPEVVRTLPWDRTVDPRVDDAVLRPDGSHYQWKSDTGVAAIFGPQLLDVVERARADRSGGP